MKQVAEQCVRSIVITAGAEQYQADLNTSPTAQRIWDALPLEGPATRWGDEIYFDIDVEATEEPGARARMSVGDVGFWPPGNAFCIFFGPTPVSMDDLPMAYSPVNVIGTLQGDATRLRAVEDGMPVMVKRMRPLAVPPPPRARRGR